MLDYLDLANLETKTIADGNEIITKGISIKINENMNINEIMAISEEAVKNLLEDLNPDKIYNFAFDLISEELPEEVFETVVNILVAAFFKGMRIDESSQSTENRRNEMVVVANTTTTDDYNSAKDDGYDVIVIETDKIKAVLAKAGVDISIYGDSLSEEQISDITGNAAVATMISNQLKTYDVPATDENISDCQNAIMQAKQLENISQDTKAYMVKNAMQPTISNVYKATYSSMQGAAVQQNTNYEISDAQFENLKPQIDEILNDAKIEQNEENINQCRWLLNNQLDVTPENILLADKIDRIALNTGKTDDTFYAKSVAEAIALGGKAIDATMSRDGLVTDCAIKAENVLKEATPEDVISLETEKEPVTIENLAIAIETRKSQSDKSGSTKYINNDNSRDNEHYNSSPDMRLCLREPDGSVNQRLRSLLGETNTSLIF